MVTMLSVLWLCSFTQATAQNVPDGQQKNLSQSIQPLVQSSPFPAPEADDVTFVVDDAPGLDTGCTFRSGGPLVFEIPVDRFIGDVDKLLAGGAIEKNAFLRMPAFDVDFDGAPGFPPERDRVYSTVKSSKASSILAPTIYGSSTASRSRLTRSNFPTRGMVAQLNRKRIALRLRSMS